MAQELLELVGRSFLLPGDEVLYAKQAVVYDAVAQVTGATGHVPLKVSPMMPAMQAAITPKTKRVSGESQQPRACGCARWAS
jgi:hypothetical protein